MAVNYGNMNGKRFKVDCGCMEKTANEIIEELKAEKAELLKTLEAANGLIEVDSKLLAMYMEKSIELFVKLAKENERMLTENSRLRKLNAELLAELMNYCAECCGNGSERCAFYNKNGDMCRMAWYGTCVTWKTICRATGHDPETPWEAKK